MTNEPIYPIGAEVVVTNFPPHIPYFDSRGKTGKVLEFCSNYHLVNVNDKPCECSPGNGRAYRIGIDTTTYWYREVDVEDIFVRCCREALQDDRP